MLILSTIITRITTTRTDQQCIQTARSNATRPPQLHATIPLLTTIHTRIIITRGIMFTMTHMVMPTITMVVTTGTTPIIMTTTTGVTPTSKKTT